MADRERGMAGGERGMAGGERGMAGGEGGWQVERGGWQTGKGGWQVGSSSYVPPTPWHLVMPFVPSFSHLPLRPVSFPLEPSLSPLSPTVIEPVSHHLVCLEGTKQLVLVKTVFLYLCDVCGSSLPYIY